MVQGFGLSNLRYWNLWDSFLNLELIDSEQNSYWAQGILFRDLDELGIILPNSFSDDMSFKSIIIRSNLLLNELEFSIEGTFFAKNKFLAFIPLDELKISNNQISHKKRVYTKDQLSNLKYCMKRDFLDYPGTIIGRSVYSFLDKNQNTPIVDNRLYFLNPIQPSFTEKEFEYVSLPDIRLYHGSPCITLTEVKSNFGDRTIQQYSITGIISADHHKISENTGVYIPVKAILDFINHFI